MKNSLPSPRFLHEFDTVDTLALRNISEKRKLQRQLGELDKQLHSNLVRMESEILSIRLEKTETSQGKGKCVKNNVAKSKQKTTKNGVKNNAQMIEEMSSNPEHGMKIKQANEATRKYCPQNVLPKITTSLYLSAKHQHLDPNEENETRLSSRCSSLETISELGQKHLKAEQRILSSLQRPESKMNVQQSPVNTSRPPTPQTANQLLPPVSPLCKQRKAKSFGRLSPLPDEYLAKGRIDRSFSAPDVIESLSANDLGRLQSRPNTNEFDSRNLPLTKTQHKGVSSDIQERETIANGIKVFVTSENGSPKLERNRRVKLDPVRSGEAGNGVSKFDEVVKKRLQLLENGVPKKEDLERIRYLRLKDGNSNTNEVEHIVDVLHENEKG